VSLRVCVRVCAYVCECECECHCECEYMCVYVCVSRWCLGKGGVGVLERVLRVPCLPLFWYVLWKIQDGVQQTEERMR